MPGPLMTTAIAIFGNESFFYMAHNSTPTTFPPPQVQICQMRNIPFSRYSLDFEDFEPYCSNIDAKSRRLGSSSAALDRFLYGWVRGLNDTVAAQEALRAAMFLANQAMLMQTADWTWPFNAREVFTSPGSVMPLPAVTLAGKVLVSVLIGAQLVGLVWVVWYIYQVPTWTPALDALAVARIGAMLGEGDLPPIGPVRREDVMRLTEIGGLVGVVDEEGEGVKGRHDGTETADVEASREKTPQRAFRLGVGAPGLISRKLAPKKAKKQRGRRRNGTESEEGGGNENGLLRQRGDEG